MVWPCWCAYLFQDNSTRNYKTARAFKPFEANYISTISGTHSEVRLNIFATTDATILITLYVSAFQHYQSNVTCIYIKNKSSYLDLYKIRA